MAAVRAHASQWGQHPDIEGFVRRRAATVGAAHEREMVMEIFEEAKRYMEELRAIPDFLERERRKGRHLIQGELTFIGTR